MEFKTRHIDKFALLLLVTYVVSIGINIASNIFFDLLAPNYPAKEIMTIQIKILSLLFHLFRVIVNIGCGVWLYYKNIQKYKWLWLFVGLFAGVLGVIVWLLKEILKEVRRNNNNHNKTLEADKNLPV